MTVAIALLAVGLGAFATAQSVPDLPAHPRGTTWIEFPNNPVHDPTDGRAYYPTVILEDGPYKMWHTGNSVGGFGIELSTSPDGINWSQPVDASSGLASFSHHAHVERIGDHYRIWYWDGSLYGDEIRTATSTDGVNWQNDQPIQQVEGDVITGNAGSEWNRGAYGLDEVIYNPAGSDTIVEPNDPTSVFQNKFVGYVGNTNGGEQSIGLAVSADGVTWEAYKDGANPVFGPQSPGWDKTTGWDATHVYPGSVVVADGFHMWYSGGDGQVKDGVGYAFSTNGVDWERADDPIFHVSDGVDWRDEETYTPTVLPSTGQMWFSGESPTAGPGFDDNPTVGYAQGLPLPGVS